MSFTNEEDFDEESKPMLSSHKTSTELNSARQSNIGRIRDILPTEQRLLKSGGGTNIWRKTLSRNKVLTYLESPFHSLVHAPWWRLIFSVALLYILIWSTFGLGYYMCLSFDPNSIHGYQIFQSAKHKQTRFDDFMAVLFFSVQTQTTIGFGNIYPANYCSNVIVATQALVGILMEGLVIGLVYAKFGRPTKRVSSFLFSNNIIVGTRDGKPCLFFRIGDLRKHQLLETHVRVYLCQQVITAEGEHHFRNTRLQTEDQDNYMLFVSGYPSTITHWITDDSPLKNDMETKLRKGEILVLFEGADSVSGSTIQARHSYLYHDIIFEDGARFSNILSNNGHGYVVDFDRFHQIEYSNRVNIN